MSATLPTLFSIQGFMMWNFWSVYMSGELKSASNRRRQLSVMFGALVWDVVLLIIGALLLFHVAGYNFVYALNAASKAYTIPSGPFYPFLASLSFNIPFLTVIIMGCFLFWSLPSMIANTFMPIRSFFAWSFDRLMPEKLADVNERTHSPVNAIIIVNVIIAALTIWSVYSNVFQLVLGLIVLAGLPGRGDRRRRRDRAAAATARPVQGVAGEREVPRHPRAVHRRAAVDRDFVDAHRHLDPVPGAGHEREQRQLLVDPGVVRRPDRRRRAALLRPAVHPGPARASTSASCTRNCRRSEPVGASGAKRNGWQA